MAELKHYLLIDIGTGSSRVALEDEKGKLFDLQHISNEYVEDDDGGTLIDAEKFFDNLKAATKVLMAPFDVKIDAITVSGARQTFFFVDDNNEIKFGIPNIDSRGTKFIGKYRDNEELVRAHTARDISADFMAMKLVGLRNNRPDLFERVSSFTSLSEVFALMFSGKLVIEPSQAEETQLYDMYSKDWDEALINVFDLGNLRFPEIVPSGTAYSVTNKKLLSEYGVTASDDCQFIVGGADTQLAMKALSPDPKKNTLCLVSGTTSPVCIRSDKPITDKNHWLDLDLGGKRYVLEFNPGVTGLNYERSKKLFMPDTSYQDIENQIDLSVKQNVFASFTTQSFSKPMLGDKFGGYFIRPPFTGSITPAALVGAVVTDIGFAISQKVFQLDKATNENFDTIIACGGGMNSKIIPQIVSTLTGKTIRIYADFQEPSIIGCFNVISDVMGGDLHDINRPIRFEYKPQTEKNGLLKDYTTWKRLNQGANNDVILSGAKQLEPTI